MMDQATVTLVNQLTLAAAALIACGFLWRAYKQSHDDHIKDLRTIITDGQETIKELRDMLRDNVADVRARVMVIEDRDGIPRLERFKYYPPANDKERAALADLDMKREKTYDDKTSES